MKGVAGASNYPNCDGNTGNHEKVRASGNSADRLIFSVASYIYAMPKLVNYLNNCVIHENAPPHPRPRVQEFQAKLWLKF